MMIEGRDYTLVQSTQIELTRIPRHVAIIMDGNRRWAKLRNKTARYGHWRGSSVVDEVVEIALELGIETLTLYTFSTENWKRSSIEIQALMGILELNLWKMRKKMIHHGICFRTIGDLQPFPDSVKAALANVKRMTAQGNKLNLVLALNYGARDELRRAAIQACSKLLEEGKSIEDLTEHCLSQHLDTAPFGDPDVIIRTGGAQRLSNFMLWQASYAEIINTPILWPDFSKNHFIAMLKEFQMRQRRLGE